MNFRSNRPRRESPRNTQTVRKEPRLSLNALSEYLTAAAGRRKSILREQKKPQTFRQVYYREPEYGIARSFATNTDGPLDAAVAKLKAIKPANKKEPIRIDTCLEAIALIREWRASGEAPVFSTAKIPAKASTPLKVGEVTISVRPELLVFNASGDLVGCVKLYFSKSDRLTEERAKYAATILHQYVQETLGAGANADPRECHVIDVFGKKVWTASRTYNKRRQDVTDACGEIEVRWPGL
jgi:hypothetical protein